MARRGPQPKHPATRQRRNATESGLTVVAGGRMEPPDPDRSWLKAQRESWVAFWSSPIGAAMGPTDVPAAERLWHLRDQWERARRVVARSPIVEGSMGQPVENPLARRMDRIAGEIRQLEDRFGLSPSARARLNVDIGDAVRSVDDITRRYAAADDDDDALRIVDVDATEVGDT